MELRTLLVTLDDNALNAAVDDQQVFDIAAVVAQVPSLTVVEGDPSYSLVVTVHPEHVGTLRRAVNGFCVIGEDAILDLY